MSVFVSRYLLIFSSFQTNSIAFNIVNSCVTLNVLTMHVTFLWSGVIRAKSTYKTFYFCLYLRLHFSFYEEVILNYLVFTSFNI